MKYIDKSWYDCTLETLGQLIEEKKIHKSDFTVFDVGCGNSVLKEEVIKKGGKWFGFDYKPRNEEIFEFDLERQVPKKMPTEKPDVIFLLEVIEHLFNPGFALQNLSKITPKDCHLFVTVPNPFWSAIRLNFFFRNKFPMFEKVDMDGNHHVFTSWPHVIERLLEKNGFEIMDRMTIGSNSKLPAFELSLTYPYKVLIRIIRKLMERQASVSKGMSYGILAKKTV